MSTTVHMTGSRRVRPTVIGALVRWGHPAVIGGACGIVTFFIYLLGARRAFDYDGSVTVGNFVDTPSLLDPLRYQINFNNHPLFSVVEHVVFSLGGNGELGLRVWPVFCAAAAVALLAGWCAARWGSLAGIAGALVLASNPMFISSAREVRGYSMMILAVVASTLLVARLLSREGRWSGVGYVAVVAIGIGTHLHAAFVLPVHVIAVLATGRLSRRWIVRWTAGFALGLLPYVNLLGLMRASPTNGRMFKPGFLEDTLIELLGHYKPAVYVLAVVSVAALVLVHRRRAAVGALAGAAASIAIVWIVLAPQVLHPRYLMWAVPLVAVGAAVVVGRWKPAIVLPLFAAAVVAVNEGPVWTHEAVPTRAAARMVDYARETGRTPCGIEYVGESVAAYTRPPELAQTAADLRSCDLTIEIPRFWSDELDAVAARTFPYQVVLPARRPIVVRSRTPLPGWATGAWHAGAGADSGS
jgi:dolichyl-phosphate-mannose-protein mannosyltransferase